MTETKNDAADAARKDTTAKELKSSDIPPELVALLERLAEGKDPTCCWIWPGELSATGYARWRSRKGGKQKRMRVSRVMCALRDGIVPRGMLVRHSCDNPSCWNPEHLLQGTIADNSRDMLNRDRSQWSGLTPAERVAKTPQFRRDVHPGRRAVIAPDGRRWECANLADEELGLSRGTIWARCTHGKSGWRWECPETKRLSRPYVGKDKMRRVRAPDGREWQNVAEASRAVGVTQATISKRCQKGIFGWRFA